MNRKSGLFGRRILFDAGPLQTIFLFRYFEQLKTAYAKKLLFESRPQLLETDIHPVGEILTSAYARVYTQLGLAEALRFRGLSVPEQNEQAIRGLAMSALRSFDFAEMSASSTYLQEKEKLISIVGVCDALHIQLLEQDPELILLTDDGRLRQHAGVEADRIVLLSDFLVQEADFT